jgi:hypothetical protein
MHVKIPRPATNPVRVQVEPKTSAPQSYGSGATGHRLESASVLAAAAAASPVQMKSPFTTEDTATQVHAAARRAVSGSSRPLPYLEQIQQSFGKHDISNIQAHTDAAAAEGAAAMGAEAFATGNHVAFAGAPDLHTAAHEAAHVVQQRAGVQLKGGVGSGGDEYERHADAVAERVVQGKSSEALLDQHAPSGSRSAEGARPSAAGAAPVQRLILTIGDEDEIVQRSAIELAKETKERVVALEKADDSAFPKSMAGEKLRIVAHGSPENIGGLDPEALAARLFQLKLPSDVLQISLVACESGVPNKTGQTPAERVRNELLKRYTRSGAKLNVNNAFTTMGFKGISVRLPGAKFRALWSADEAQAEINRAAAAERQSGRGAGSEAAVADAQQRIQYFGGVLKSIQAAEALEATLQGIEEKLKDPKLAASEHDVLTEQRRTLRGKLRDEQLKHLKNKDASRVHFGERRSQAKRRQQKAAQQARADAAEQLDWNDVAPATARPQHQADEDEDDAPDSWESWATDEDASAKQVNNGKQATK